MVRLKGVEPLAHGLEVRCSIQLSYRRIFNMFFEHILERVMGIEPTRSAWKAEVLPLNYTRTSIQLRVKTKVYMERVTRFELATFTLAR